VTASQISHGRENDIFVEIDGTKAAIEWHQENPNQLFVRKNGEPHKVYTRAGGPYLSPAAAAATRIPSGHPEGYLEAFANIYTAAYDAMAKRASGQKFETTNTVYPNVYDGLEGMLFITQCVQSSKENGAWLPFTHPKLRK
jgi:predicted dehydrogenase